MSPAAFLENITAGDECLIERLVTAADATDRRAVTWINYTGDQTSSIAQRIELEHPMGPNTIGEWLWPVSASFDPDKNRTRVGFSYVQPAASEVLA